MLLEVAREAFLEAGEASAVSLRAVAQRAGIDEALIHRHFSSKEQLYMEAVADPVIAVINEFAETVRTAAKVDLPDDKTRREWNLTHRLFVELLSLDPQIMRAMGMLLFGNPAHAESFYAQTLGPAIAILDQLGTEEQANWEHRDYSPSLVVRMTFATGFWIVNEHTITGTRLDVPTLARELTDRLFYGMASADAAGLLRNGTRSDRRAQ